MRSFAVLFVLLLCPPLWAQAPVKITGNLKVPANKLVRLYVEGDVKNAALIWDVDREDLIDPEEYPGKYVFAAPPGKYKVKLRVVRSKGEAITVDTVRTEVEVEGSIPVPPVPPPKPPTPPVPPPVPPEDALKKSIDAAYAAETDPAKKDLAYKLGDLYRYHQARLNDTGTWGPFFDAMRAKAKELGVSGKLPQVQRVLQGESLKALPGAGNPSAAITQADREVGGALFGKFADILEGYK